MAEGNPVVEAIQDLTRVMLALNGDFQTTAEAIRKLLSLSIPPSRVAALLGVDTKHVTSTMAKDKKKTGGGSGKNGKD